MCFTLHSDISGNPFILTTLRDVTLQMRKLRLRPQLSNCFKRSQPPIVKLRPRPRSDSKVHVPTSGWQTAACWPHPIHCLVLDELKKKMVFLLLKSRGGPKEQQYFKIWASWVEFKFQCLLIKFYWKITMPVGLFHPQRQL